MLSFLIGRLTRIVVTLVVLVTVVFVAVRLTGDPLDYLMPDGMDAQSRQVMTTYWGLDRPIWDQYLLFWRQIFSGEFGLGLMERRPVTQIFGERVWQSASLLLSTLALTTLVGVPVGILAAIWRRSAAGSALLSLAFLGYAIPNFVLAILMLLIFSFWLRWLPSAGSATIWHYIMPTVALSAFFAASLARYTRSAMLDVLSQDYMRTARAKGLSEPAVILKHGLRNALIPIITVLGLQITTLVSGAVVVETVFAWNGIGDLLVNATLNRDYPVIQFGVFVIAGAVILINLFVDLTYAVIDPRISVGGEA